MKKYPHGLTLNAVCAAIDDYQRHEDSVPEEGILAAFNTLLGHSDIAAAFRALEQRAEAAEGKLSELAKQEPEAWLRCPEQGFHLPMLLTKDQGPPPVEGEFYPVFTRPAPAADLAELVPPGWKLVPEEPTKQMLEASYREASVYSPTAYRAMLAAAPTPNE